MVTANGETIFPEEIEPYYCHPDFKEYCVAPFSGGYGNDKPMLVIYPTEGAGELKQIVYQLASKAPGRVRIHDYVVVDHPLPRTELGKVQRRKLAMLIEGESNG